MHVALKVAALPLLGAALPTGPHQVRFAPEPGATLVISIEQSSRTNMVYESWCPLNNGVRDEEEAYNVDGSSSVEYEIAIILEDTYGPIRKDVGPQAKAPDARSGLGSRFPYESITRSFKAIDGEATTAEFTKGDEKPETTTVELSSPLSGRAVQFAWNQRSGSFVPTFGAPRDKKASEGVLLSSLHVDGSGDWFLPPWNGGPADGPRGDQNLQPTDRWDVPPAAWYAMLDIGGYFWIGPEASEPPSRATLEAVQSINAQLVKNAAGRIVCQFEELREVDGRQLAVLSIDANVTSKATSDRTDEHGGTREKVTETVEQTIHGKGECLWDIAGKRCHSIEIRSESTDRTSFVSIQRKNARETSGAEILSVEETVSDFVMGFEVR